jgi:hypothetical protein
MSATTNLNVRVNAKQLEFIQTITANKADFIQRDPKNPTCGQAYQAGLRATFQGARGSGKTNVLLRLIANSAFELPQALAGLAGKTYKQVQDIVLSQAKTVWLEEGLIEYNTRWKGFGHYVINTRPPAHWPKPHNVPRTYDNTITFCNGYTIIMVSGDRPETQRGLNLDQLFIDESATIPVDFKKVLIPTVRANKYKYADTRPDRRGYNHPLHWLVCDFTSAPWLPEGKWIYQTKEKAKENPDRYYWIESTAFDNLEFLPGNFIESQREDLTPHQFDVEIMNIPHNKIEGGFYSAFNASIHTYDKIYKYVWNTTENKTDIARLDYDPTKAIDISFDFNSRFTSMVVAQDFGEEYRVIDCFFVKTSTTTLIHELMGQFHAKYGQHSKKKVTVYGDASGKVVPVDKSKSIYQQIEATFKGWTYNLKVRGFNVRYKFRYKVINTLLLEQKPELPKLRISQDNCKPLIISIESAPIDSKYEKDKTSEKRKNFPQEFATHLSDALDYLLYEKFAKKILISQNRTTGIVSRTK